MDPIEITETYRIGSGENRDQLLDFLRKARFSTKFEGLGLGSLVIYEEIVEEPVGIFTNKWRTSAQDDWKLKVQTKKSPRLAKIAREYQLKCSE